MENNLIYVISGYICLFGVGLDVILCRYARTHPYVNIIKIQNIHDYVMLITILSAIVNLCSLIIK